MFVVQLDMDALPELAWGLAEFRDCSHRRVFQLGFIDQRNAAWSPLGVGAHVGKTDLRKLVGNHLLRNNDMFAKCNLSPR